MKFYRFYDETSTNDPIYVCLTHGWDEFNMRRGAISKWHGESHPAYRTPRGTSDWANFPFEIAVEVLWGHLAR